MPGAAIFGTAVFGASSFGVTVTYSSEPGAVQTAPGNIEPGALPPLNVDATVAQPSSWFGAAQATTPAVSAGVVVVQPVSFLGVGTSSPTVQAGVVIAAPSSQSAAIRAASPNVTTIGQIVVSGRLPYYSQPGHQFTRPGALEPGALDAGMSVPGRHRVSDAALFVHTVTDAALIVHSVSDLVPVG